MSERRIAKNVLQTHAVQKCFWLYNLVKDKLTCYRPVVW